jgi:micrococcal nuclease
MEKQTKIIFIICLIFAIILIWSFTFFRTYETKDLIERVRVIDGDTLEINGETIRLLGINCPEKGEKYYEEAKEFLENLTTGKEIEIKRKEKDIYGRTLAYIFLDGKNVNLEIIKEGYANPYYPISEDTYSENMYLAWEECTKNLCEKSSILCLEIESISIKNQELVLRNDCNYLVNLEGFNLKDEGRKKYIFPEIILKSQEEINIVVGDSEDTTDTLFWNRSYVWTESGDMIILRDYEDKLVLFKRIKS